MDSPESKPEEKNTPPNGGNGNGTKRKPWLMPLGIIVLIVAVIMGVRYYLYAKVHTGTDDAYVASDVIQIAPQVSGTVTQVLVKENEHVQAGQVIARIDPSTYQQAVDQAKAALDLAISQEQGAETTTNLTRAQGNAGIQAAEGVLLQSSAGKGSAQADVARAAAAVSSARASAQGAKSGISNAQSAVASARAQVYKSQAAVDSAASTLQQSKTGIGTAQSALASAQANYNKAHNDYLRSQVLFSEGAIAASQNDAYHAASDTAAAQLSSAQSGLASAHAAVDTATSNLAGARAALQSSRAAVAQTQAQLQTSRSMYASANDQVNQLISQQVESVQNVSKASGSINQAQGQLEQAKTAPTQLQVSMNQILQAKAKVEQARAALDQARINLGYCVIKAPVTGQVTHKSVFEGSLVANGTPLMALVPDELMWVMANFKETQLDGVKIGDRAEVEVDSIPGYTFTGSVQSISKGTGSTFALLPPDNATGNFTKVVQRVPIKIVFDKGQKDLDLLRSGMSVTATIDLKGD
ncbi:MAG TPA: biotin/lipoyl-binding protein [Fimbriimonadaceae bacterium]|jgi:membrane fusion protein (multidrug efflux system)